MIRLICTARAKCAYHADGGSPGDKCPGTCDTGACRRRATVDIGDKRHCAQHARHPGRPVSTGSDSTPRVSFAVGRTAYASIKARADRDGVSPGELAKRLTLAVIGE